MCKKYPHIIKGQCRRLTPEEIKNYSDEYSQYKWVVTKPYICHWGDKMVIVPEGFMSDGASGGPDWGVSWIFHDYLYSSHCFDQGGDCEREEADCLMYRILLSERLFLYAMFFRLTVALNFRGSFDLFWKMSGNRGPQFLPFIKSPF